MTEKHKKDDEEIAIDFSKIKNWFSAKKHTEHHHAQHTHEEKQEHHKKDESSEDINFDYKGTLNFFKRYATIFLILIPVIITVYLRAQAMYLPITDEWAQNTVYNYYKNQVASQITQQYPNLPDANKQALIDSEFNKFLQQNKDTIKQQVDGTSQSFKEQLMYESGNSKYVYLSDIDSYFWLREARKVIEKGYDCDEIDFENQLCYEDTYTQAPLKGSTPLKGAKAGTYSQVIIYTYKTLKLFNSDITIMQASLYVPTIFGVISAILAFLIGKLIAGNIGGLIASIFISTNPIHLSRTMGSDNDPQNILFPLLIVLFFLYTSHYKDLKRRLLFGALTGLSIAIFALAWQGWWFMFNFLVVGMIIYAGFHMFKHFLHHKDFKAMFTNPETKNILTMLVTIIVSSALFITITSSFSTFTSFITGPLWFSQSKVAALATYWPNVLVTVAEFNPGSIATIIGQMGGKLLFFLGLMGIIFVVTYNDKKMLKEQKYILGFGLLVCLLLVSNYGVNLSPKIYMALLALPLIISMLIMLRVKEDVDLKLAILLVIWFIATTYAALKGVRFTLLMVSAFGVALAITISSIYRIVTKWVADELRINELITKTVVGLLLLLILISPIKSGYVVATNYIPNVNDAWYSTLTNIRDNSQPDAIINSWWDFGHWFKYLADRRVTLDGSSQSGPPLHWLGKLMVTDDEKLSVGILRMLDCGSNTAFDKLSPIINDAHESIKILDKIITIDTENAKKYLIDNGLDETQADEVLKYTHCNAPENFFITSEDMVGKAGVWAHFGSWDFSRAEMYSLVKGKTAEEGKKILMNEEYNLTSEEADQYYYEIQTQEDNQWITPWPSYVSGVQPCEKPDSNGIMVCTQGISGQAIPFIINLTNMDVVIPAKEKVKPYSITYVTEDGTREKLFGENTYPFSLILIPTGDGGYASLISQPQLANSIFTRLFYLEGHGLQYFDKFNDQRGITGGRIITWKVDWDGKDSNAVYYSKADIDKNETKAETNTTTKKKTSYTSGKDQVNENSSVQ